MRIKLAPRYAVKRKSPAKIPIVNPGKVTARLAPSVFTAHDALLKEAVARRISAAVLGGPSVRLAGGFVPRPAAGGSGMNKGASQKAYHRFFAITSGVSSTPAARSGSACWVDMRRTPVTT